MTKKSVVQNLALLVAAVAAGILGLEAFLRMLPQFLPEEARLRVHWSAVGGDRDANGHVMSVPDPYLGFRFRPNSRGHLRRGDLDFTFTTDEKGFRNSSPWPEAADIVITGDSMAFGYGVPDDATWTHRVATQLHNVTIINLGLIGGGPQQYLRVLEADGLELNPKLVLFMLFPGNDLSDANLFQEWLEAHTDITYPEWRIAGGAPGDWNPLRRLLNGSYLMAFLRAFRHSLLSTGAGETITFGDGQRLQLAPAAYDGNAQMADPAHPVFQLVMTTIEEAQRLSQRQRSHFLVLLMPTKEEVYLPLLDKPAPALIARFKPALAAQRIPFIDLTPYFQARAREVGPLFFEVDGHPNADGYRLVAGVLIDYLRQHGEAYGLGDWRSQESRNHYDAFRACCSDRMPRSAGERRLASPGSGTHALVHDGSIYPPGRRSIRRVRGPAGRCGALGDRAECGPAQHGSADLLGTMSERGGSVPGRQSPMSAQDLGSGSLPQPERSPGRTQIDRQLATLIAARRRANAGPVRMLTDCPARA